MVLQKKGYRDMVTNDHPRLGPEDLPFWLSDDVRQSIRNLIEAYKRDDPMLDCYQDDLHAAGRDLNEIDEEWLHRYYLRGGWRTMDETGEYEFPEQDEDDF